MVINMKNLKVSMKLIISFLIVVILMAFVGGIGLFGMANMNGMMTEIYEYNVLPIESLGNLREIFGTQRSDFRAIFLSHFDPNSNTDAVNDTVNKIKQSDKLAEENFALYEKYISNVNDEDDYFTAKNAWTGPYAEMKLKLWALIDVGDFETAYSTFIAAGPSCIGPITSGFAGATAYNETLADDKSQEGNQLYTLLFWLLMGIMVISVAISMFLAFYVAGLISNPLKPLEAFMTKAGTTGNIAMTAEDSKVIQKYSQVHDEIGKTIAACAKFINHVLEINGDMANIANGDLTTKVHLLSEQDSLGIALKAMEKKLSGMFGEIDTATVQVFGASKQIADGAQGLAQASTEQAASVEQLSSSIQEITVQIKDNASMATEAAGLSSDIRTKAEKGSSQMDDLMQAVHEITEASSQIEKVIKVIDDIAFQTNILALNAAVEAARAGEAGKGFAVVAEEVRNLASKSAEAAKNTSGLIENSISKANLGLSLANETTASLKDIVDGINRSADIIHSIAQSTDSQATAIAHLNIGVEQVANVVQQNSATAQESAAASEEMSGQSTLLRELVAQFKT
ncbi:MAG: methyl-accepting chemotaxis protein [Oscillospiraceae bacterium]|nr:methyl-accepting chemotaxis protein [Oscillospiraceae bacterium]